MERPTRRSVLAGAGAGLGGLAGLSGCLGFGTDSGSESGGDGPTTGTGTTTDSGGDTGWRTAELTDVRTGETFRVADLPKPVMLETFAVWCSKCLRQQRELRTLHERMGDRVTSVTLNVDPNEDAEKVRSHLEEHGFDWRYAVSPPAVTDALVEQFGSTMTVAPRAPVVLVCEGDARRLPDGVKSADTLAAAVEEGC